MLSSRIKLFLAITFSCVFDSFYGNFDCPFYIFYPILLVFYRWILYIAFSSQIDLWYESVFLYISRLFAFYILFVIFSVW